MKTAREIIIDENPFSLEFDTEKLNELIEDEKLEEENKNIIEFFFFCHIRYRNCYKELIEVFESLKLTNEEAVRFIYVLVNYNYNEIRKLFFRQLESKKKDDSIFNLESVFFEKITTDNNVNISLIQGVEKGGDIVIILHKFLNTFGDDILGEKTINDFPDDLLIEYSQKLWYYAMQLFAFNSFYEIIKYQNGEVIIEEDKKIIKVKKSEKNITLSALEVIGEIRKANNYHEYSYGFKNIQKEKIREKSFISTKTADGIILPNIGYKNSKESYVQNAFLTLTPGNIFSENNYNGLNLIDLIKVFSSISQLVGLVAEETLTKNLKLKDIPYTIDKNLLIEKIKIITNLDKEKIINILDSIVDRNESPYFWRKPLYESNNKIYLAFSLLTSPNYNLLLESYLDSLKIDLNEKLESFKNYILSELVDLEYCKVIESNDIPDVIILEFRDYFLSINIFFTPKFPIEAKDNLDYLDMISFEISKIEERIKRLNNDNEKKYVPIILTNYNKYSGLVVNEIPVLDIILLENYLITGAFQKGQIVRNKQGIKSDILSGFTYYDDEDDFNNNLFDFIYYPVPVHEIKNKIYWIETPTLSLDSNFQIYVDNYNYETSEGNIEYELNILSNALKKQYLVNLEGKINHLANKVILFRITNVFHYITFSKYQLTSYRHDLINLFSEININGYVHLFHYFRISLRYLNNIKLKKDNKFKSLEYNAEEVFKSLEKIFEKNNKFSISTLEFDHKYTKDEEKKIISLAIDVISTLTIKKYELEEIENYLLMLSIIRYFKLKYNLDDYFYLGASNIVSALNHNFLYQQARNLSEEIFAIAIKEKKEYKGWGILFLCSDQQRNKFKSIIYSCFYLNSLSVVSKLPYREAIEIFYNILKFARNLELTEILNDVFNFMIGLGLEEYDFQKVHLTYYLSIINRKGKDRRKIIDDSILFFTENKDFIFKYGDKGALPWLNYFYNVKRLGEEGFEEINVDHIIKLIENVLDEKVILPIKSRHFYNTNTKKDFIKNLKKVFSTYYINDFVSEISNLELDASLIIENAILRNDFESILLTGIVYNDIRLIYKENNNISGEVEFEIDNSYSEVFDQYLKYILDKLLLKPNQLFVYLFSHKNQVYYLKINDKKEIMVEKVKSWSAKKNFLKNREKFYFNSANYYGIEEQEEAYKELLSVLQYTSLDINDKFDELLITTNLELSNTPLNLIVNNGDFIGSKNPVSNILLIEWFIENSEDLIINDLSVNCWIPIEDGDPTLNLGYDKIKPVLDEYKIETFTKSIPDQILKKEINIFFAHGELDNIGFKVVSVNDEKFVVNKERIFGSGEIAILFICHSGSINEDLFSNKVQSLIYDLIQHGYKAVIAPFWALEATIPSFWLKFFLESFKEGYTISESVCLANNTLANYQQEISDAFFVPEGRLAMHLYGNPNIVLKNENL